MSRIVVVIPARGGSKGIPRKNLIPLCGKTLVAWTIEQAKAADIGPVIVATDDPEISRVANGYGVTVYEETEDMAGDSVSMEEVMRWIVGAYKARTGTAADWLMVCQPTSPLKLASHLREVAAICKTNAFNSVFSVVPSAHCSWRQKAVEGIVPEWPHQQLWKRMLRQEAGQQWTENGAIYAVKASECRDTRFIAPMHLYEMPEWTRFEVDSPEDLAIVELIMRTRLRLGADGVRT